VTHKAYTTVGLMLLGLLAACAAERDKSCIAEAAPVAARQTAKPSVAWTDSVSGADITRLTDGSGTCTNVYMEQRYTSADGKRIVIQRYLSRRKREVLVCDLSTRHVTRVGEGRVVTASFARNAVYYLVRAEDGARLMRLDLADLSKRETLRFARRHAPRRAAISPDERWLVGGPFRERDNLYRLDRVDLKTGKTTELCRIEDMWNPHLQFDPGNPRRLLVQINRRGKTPEGPLGATLAIIDAKTGKVTPLPVGRPHTSLISGHESWAGRTGRLLFTAAPGSDKIPLDGRGVYAVTPGEENAKPIALGRRFNHLAVSDDGRFFIVDDHGTQEILVGSAETGRFLKLCDSRTQQGRSQSTHAHPYMTPDNKHVIFNSTVSGSPQVYAARMPIGFLEEVLVGDKTD